MSIYVNQHASSFSEFLHAIKSYAQDIRLAHLRKSKIAVATRFCEYLCNNTQFVVQSGRLAECLEEILTKFWREDLWIGARIYLQILFPNNSALLEWRKISSEFRMKKYVQKNISSAETMLISDLLKIV